MSLQGLEESALTALTEAEAVLLDPTAVAALALLELVDVPGRLGARIVVPQEFLDQLQNEILHRRLSEGREHIVLGVEGDQIVRRVISAEEAARATQVLSGIREKCKAFEVAPRPVTPGKWSDWADRDLLGADSADAVAIARSTGAVLVSADARLLAAVANDYGVKICTVYDLVNYFQRKGLLSEEAFESVVAAMVWHGFEHTPIRASTLLRTLRSAGYEHSGRFERLLDVLSNPTTDIESAVRVVANFLGALNQLPVIPPNIESIVRRVLERLVRGQDVTRVRALRRFAGTAPLPNWLKTLVKKCANQVEEDITKGHFVQS
jgi:predicted nucleic acid-binding protein